MRSPRRTRTPDGSGARRHPHPRRPARPPPARPARRADRRRGADRRHRHLLLPRRRRRQVARLPAGRPRLPHRLRPRRAHRRPRRRRPLHRPHRARRDRRPLRLRPPASGSSSPSSATAATASCRSAPTTSARTCRPRASERVNVRLEEIDEVDEVTISEPQPAEAVRMKHLLSIEELSREEIEAILDRAESFAEVGRRDIKKVPTLRGRTVVTLFYESSTRTSSSFELAAKRLSADLVSVKAAGSSVDKGESLKDTVATLSAYDPAAIVIRHPHAGAAQLVAGWTERRGRQRRRRQARAPEPGAARRLHPAPPARLARGQADLDRRRRPPQPRRPLQPDRLPADGRRGHRSAARRP